ncbi:MAG: hypothetical protein NTY19_00945 [Planctomycetota bacterium]|nr:hypothetical protein [Planctomycetota bacterium]
MTKRNATPKNTTSQRDVHEMMLRSSIASGRELIVNAADLLRRYAEEMDRYATRYDDCGNDPSVKHESVLSWAVNHVVHIHGNLRLDLMVTKAAEIAERRTQATARPDDEA